MTCIVGIETKSGVMMGCDSAAVRGWDIHQTRLKKVFRVGSFIIGGTHSFRMAQILQYKLDVNTQVRSQSNLEYMATTFVDAARSCLSENGYTKIESNQETGGEFLVGYKRSLYCIFSDFHVGSIKDGFYSIGCGSSYALGSLYSSNGLSAKKRLKKALAAANRFSNGVCKPFHIIKT